VLGIFRLNNRETALAIIFEFNVMLARKFEIDSKYPGGLAQFSADWLEKPPERWCVDEQLLAFSSMGSYFEPVYESLLACGVDVLRASEATSPDEILSRWNWLAFDTEKRTHEIPGHGVFIREVPRFWLRGEEPGETAQFLQRRTKSHSSGFVAKICDEQNSAE
jgi:hypothetical protein